MLLYDEVEKLSEAAHEGLDRCRRPLQPGGPVQHDLHYRQLRGRGGGEGGEEGLKRSGNHSGGGQGSEECEEVLRKRWGYLMGWRRRGEEGETKGRSDGRGLGGGEGGRVEVWGRERATSLRAEEERVEGLVSMR